MGSFSLWHWMIVLVIVMLVFGTKRLRNIGSDLGGAVKGFRDGMADSATDTPPDASLHQRVAGQTLEAESGKSSLKKHLPSD